MVYRRYLKRLLDILLALLALPLLLLLVLLIGPMIWVVDRGAIFYLGKRRGVEGNIF